MRRIARVRRACRSLFRSSLHNPPEISTSFSLKPSSKVLKRVCGICRASIDGYRVWGFGDVRFGRSSFISLFSRKLSASQPICPMNMSRISISRVDHIKVT